MSFGSPYFGERRYVYTRLLWWAAQKTARPALHLAAVGFNARHPLLGLLCALSSQGCPVLAMCFTLRAIWWVGANACLSLGRAVGNFLSCPSNAFKLPWLLILYVNFIFNILSKSCPKKWGLSHVMCEAQLPWVLKISAVKLHLSDGEG